MSAVKTDVIRAMRRYADMARDATQGAHAIRAGMEILGAGGTTLGVVDRVDGAAIQLSREGFRDGRPHFVPLSDVARVDRQVHLAMTAQEFCERTRGRALACGG